MFGFGYYEYILLLGTIYVAAQFMMSIGILLNSRRNGEIQRLLSSLSIVEQRAENNYIQISPEDRKLFQDMKKSVEELRDKDPMFISYTLESQNNKSKGKKK